MQMGKILDAFADDELSVNPSLYNGSARYRQAVDKMCEAAEALEAKLNDEEKKLFEQFRDAQGDESHLYQVDVFSRGFRIAVLMLFEVFAAGKDEFILSKSPDQ